MARKDTPISAVLADVDGTLLTKDKLLTERARAAVDKLRDRGIVFTITSGRPPFGMRMLVDPLGLKVPMAAFNGGALLLPDLSILDERPVAEYLVPALIQLLLAHELDVFVYRLNDWFVRKRDAPRVARETSTLQQPPVVVRSFDDIGGGVMKVTGVGNDPAKVAACEAAIQQAFGGQISAERSQPYYLDITDACATKRVVIERLSRYLKIPLDRFATLGDQPNDVLMFERSGLSIAMGQASDAVKARATAVTASYGDEGFAHAVETMILPRAEPAGGPGARPTAWLHRLGQSLWLDNLTREMLQSGGLRTMIDEMSLTGLTSNPTIFEQAIQKGSAYDSSIAGLARQQRSPEDMFFEIALSDISQAADLFRPIHDRSAGMDGWVSLEVSPLLANDAPGTLAAAKSLFQRVGRSNVMIKIPGTQAGLAAIEEAIFEGIPINVTLLFSREQYLASAHAFLRGVERRIDAGKNPDVPSVASLFVSRWDRAVASTLPKELHMQLGIAMAQVRAKVAACRARQH
jgi:Cof subfamily protein (haloacid dehalogenase superfamily)